MNQPDGILLHGPKFQPDLTKKKRPNFPTRIHTHTHLFIRQIEKDTFKKKINNKIEKIRRNLSEGEGRKWTGAILFSDLFCVVALSRIFHFLTELHNSTRREPEKLNSKGPESRKRSFFSSYFFFVLICRPAERHRGIINPFVRRCHIDSVQI